MLSGLLRDVITANPDRFRRTWDAVTLLGDNHPPEMGPGRHPQSTAVVLYFPGPEGFTYEYSFGVRRIEDAAASVPRPFDAEELVSIDMWLDPQSRTVSQPSKAAGSQPAPRDERR